MIKFRVLNITNRVFGVISTFWLVVGLVGMAAPIAFAGFSEFNDAVENGLHGDWGKINFDLRWRFEYVDQEGKKISRADPIRLRLGYLTPKWKTFQAYGEFEGNTPVFFDDYNSLKNGKTDYAVIADPDEAELNQGWLAFSAIPDTIVTGGRQKIVFNNHRFVGNVGWRQMEQTYDAVLIVNQTFQNTELKFAFVTNVRTITSSNVDMQSPLLNLGYNFPGIGKLTAYGYWLDYDDPHDSGPFAYAFSTRTYGIRFKGSASLFEDLSLFYTAEYAYQTDYKDNPASYGANYYNFMAGVKLSGVEKQFSSLLAKIGWEYLGSDKGVSFKTPLGTNHAFQGWADKFLVTPPDGVVDLQGALGATIWGVGVLGVFHRFEAAEGGAHYGDEIDLQITKTFGQHYSLLLAYANYFADDYKTDTQKFWLQGGINF